MKYGLLTFMALAFISLGQAQEIKMKKVLGGYKLTQASETLDLGEVQEIIQKNDEAFRLMELARPNHSIATILGIAGGALIGAPIGAAIAGGDADWAMAGIGAGLVALSIPFKSGANIYTRSAIEKFNASLPYSEEPGDRFKPKWERPFSFGLRAGVNLSELDYDHPKLEVDGSTGYHVGAFMDFRIFESLHIQPEVLYSKEGAKDQTLSYLNVPVLLKWYYTSDLHLTVGPQIGFLLDAEEIKEDLKSQNFSAALGMGYEAPQGLLFDVRFIAGLNSILVDDFSIPSGQGYNLSGIGAWPRSIQFSLGYKF